MRAYKEGEEKKHNLFTLFFINFQGGFVHHDLLLLLSIFMKNQFIENLNESTKDLNSSKHNYNYIIPKCF